jgi:hypothetical protein
MTSKISPKWALNLLNLVILSSITFLLIRVHDGSLVLEPSVQVMLGWIAMPASITFFALSVRSSIYDTSKNSASMVSSILALTGVPPVIANVIMGIGLITTAYS